MIHSFTRSGAIASLLLALATVSPGANAVELDKAEIPHRKVSFADLDLSQPRDVSRLYARIGVAARQVCPDTESASLYLAAVGRDCIRDSTARAVRDVGSSALTQYHLTKTSQRVLLAERN